MKPLLTKVKPVNGFGYFLHLGLIVLLPLALYVLVGLQLVIPALVIILLSKWRIIAVKPRFWPALLRANAIDIIVGLSVLAFMVHSGSLYTRALFAIAYGIWLLVIKPKTTTLWVSTQAAIGQFAGLTALFMVEGGASLFLLVLGAGMIGYFTARHFFDSYDEPYSRLLSYTWGYFSASLLWILGHWLLFYGFLAQPTLILSALGYGLAALYYFDHENKLSPLLRRQFIFIMAAILIVVLAFSDWDGKIV
jgi:hypothetical protein